MVSLEKIAEPEIDHKLSNTSDVIADIEKTEESVSEIDTNIPEVEILDVKDKDKDFVQDISADVETDEKVVGRKDKSLVETVIDQDSIVDKTQLSEADLEISNVTDGESPEQEKQKADLKELPDAKTGTEAPVDQLTIITKTRGKGFDEPEKTDFNVDKTISEKEKDVNIPEKRIEKTDLQIQPKDIPKTIKERAELQIEPTALGESPERAMEKAELEILPKTMDSPKYKDSMNLEITPKDGDIEIPETTEDKEKMSLNEKIDIDDTIESPAFSVSVHEKEIYDTIDNREESTVTVEEHPEIPESTIEREILSLHEKIDLDENPESPTFSVTVHEKETYDVVDDQEVSTVTYEEYPELPEIQEKTELSVHEKIDIDETPNVIEQPQVESVSKGIEENEIAENPEIIPLECDLAAPLPEVITIYRETIPKQDRMPEIDATDALSKEKDATRVATELVESSFDASKTPEEKSSIVLSPKNEKLDVEEENSVGISKIPDMKELLDKKNTMPTVSSMIRKTDLDEQEKEEMEIGIGPSEKDAEAEITEKPTEKLGLQIELKKGQDVSEQKYDFQTLPKHQESPEKFSEKAEIELSEKDRDTFEEYPELPEIPEKSEVSVHEKIDIDETTDTKQQPTVKPKPEESVDIDSAEKSKLISSDDELKIDIDSKIKELDTPEKTKLDTQILDSKIDKGAEVPDKEMQRVGLQIEPKEVPRTEVERTEIQIKPEEKDLDILEKTSGKTALEIQPKHLDNKQYQEKLEFKLIPKEEGIEIPEKMKEEFPGIPASTEEREIVSLNEKIDLDETPKSPTFSVTTREKETFDVIDDTEESTFSFEEYPVLPEIPEKSEVSVHEKIDIDETTDTKQQPTVKPIPEESVEIDSTELSKLISSDDELKIDIDSKIEEHDTPEKTKLDTQILDSKIDKGAEVLDKEMQRVDLQIEPKEVPRTEVESTEIQIKPKEKDLDIFEKTSGKTALEIQPKILDNKQYQEKLEFEIIPKEEGIEIPEKMKEEFPGIPASTEEREIVSLNEKIDLDETPKSPTFSVTTREKETFDVIDDTEVSTFSFEEYPELPEIPEKSEVSVHEKIDIDETTDTKQQPTVKPIPEESVEIDSAEKSKLISSDDELKIDIDSKLKEIETPEKTKLDTQILDSKIDKGAEVPDKEMQKVDLQIKPKEVPRTEEESTEIQIKPKEKDLDISEKTSGKTALEIQPKDLDNKQYQEKLEFEIIPKEEGIEIPEKMKEEFPGIPASTEEREIVSLHEKIDLDETPKSPTFLVTTREKETFDVIDDTEVSTFSFEEYPELPEIPEKSEVSVHEKIDIDETTDTKQQPTVRPIPEESVEIDSAEKSKLISSDDELKIDIDSKIKEIETPKKTKLDTQILDSKIDKGAEVPDKEMQRVDLQIEPKEVPRSEVERTEIQIKPKGKDLDILEKTSRKTALEIQPKDLDNKQYQEKLEFEIIPKEEGIEIPEKMKEEFPGIPASTEEREIVSLNEKIDLDETPKSPTFSVTTREKETFDVIDDTEVSTFSFEEYPELPEIPEKSEVSVHEKIDIDETTDTKQQPTVKPIPEESVEIDSAEKSKLISSDDELKIDIDSKLKEIETPEKTKLDTQILDSKIDKGAEVPDKEMQRVDLQIKPKEVPRTEEESTEIQIKPKEKDLDISEKTSGKTALEIQPKDLDNKQYQEKLEFEIIPKEEGIEIPEKMKEEFPGIPASTEEREIVSLHEKIDLDETPKSPTFLVTTREKETFDVIDDTEVSTFSFEEYPELPEIPEKSEVSVHEKIDIDETTDTKQQPTVRPIPEESVEIDSAEKSKLISSDDELKIDIDSKIKEIETPKKTKLDTQILDSKIDKGAEVPDKEMQRVDLQIEPKEVPRSEVERTEIQIKPKEKDLDILEKTSRKTALEIQPKDLDNKQYQEKLEFEIIPKEEGIEIPEKMKEEFPGIPASTEEREKVSLNEKIDLDETPKSPTFSVTTREKETFDVIDDTEVSTFSFEEYPELPEIPEKSEVSVHEKIDIDETTDTKQQPTVKQIPEESVEIDSAEKSKLISSDDELKIDIDSKLKEIETPEKTKLDTQILDSKIDKDAEVPDKEMQRVDLQIEPKEVPRTEVESTEIQIKPKEKDLDILLEKTSGKTALEIQPKDLDNKQYQEKLEFEIIPKEEGIEIPEKMKEEFPGIPASTEEREIVSLHEKIDLDETPKSPTFSVTTREKETFDVIDDTEVSTFSFEEYPELPEIPEKSEVSVHEKIDIDETTDTKQQPTVRPIPEQSVEIDSAEKSKLISSDDELKIDIDSKIKELETPEKTKLDTQILDFKIDKGAEVPDKEMQRVDLQIEPKEVPRTEGESTEIQIKPKEKDLDISEKTSGKTALEIQPKDLDNKQYQEKLEFEIIPKEEGIEIPEKMKEEFPGIPASTEEREIVSLHEKIDLDETPKSPTFSVTTREKETFDVIDDTEVSTFSFEEYPELPEIPEKSEVSVHEKIDIDETTDTKQQPTVRPIPEESVEIDSAEKSKLISSDDELKIDIDSKIKEIETPKKTKLDTQILDSKIDKGAEVPDKEMQRVDLQIEPKEVPRTEVERTEIQIKPKEKDLDILEKTSRKTALEIQPKDLDNKQYQEKLEFEIIPKEEGIEIPEKMKEEFPGIPASTEEREIVSLNEKIDLDETPKSPTFSVTTREKETFDVIDDTEVSTFSFEEYPELPEIPEKSEVSVHEKIDIDETTDTKQQPTVKQIPEESVEIDSAEKSKLISSDDELKIDIDSKIKEIETPEKTKLDTQILDSKIDKDAEVPDKEMQRVDLQIEPKEVPRTEVESTEIQIKPKEKDLDILEKTSGKTALEIQPKDLDNKQYQEKLEFEIIPKEEGIERPEKMKEEFPGIPASTEEREIVSLHEKIDLDETPKSPTFSVTTREKETFDVIDDTEVSTFSFEEYPELPEIPEKYEVSVHEKIDIDETTDTKQQPTVRPIPEESVEIDSAEKSKLISSDDELKIDIDSKIKELETPKKTKLDTQILDFKIDKGAEVPDKEMQRVDLQIEPKEVPRTEVESTEIQIKPKEKDLDISEKTSGKTALEIQPKDLDNKQYQEKLEFEIIPKEEGIEVPEKMKEEFPGIPASTEEREIVSLHEKIDLDETPKSPTFSVTTREKETFDVIDDTEVSTFSFEDYPELPEIPEKSEVSVHEKIDIDETTDTKQQPTVRPIPEESVEIDSAEKAKLISSDDELKIDIDSKIKERETPEKTKLDTQILDSKIDKGAEVPDKEIQRVDLQIEPKEVPRTEVESTEIQIKPKEKDLDILEKTSGKTALEIQPKDLDNKQYQEKLELEIIPKEEGIEIPEKMKEEFPGIPASTEEREIVSLNEKIDLDETPKSPTFSVTPREKETFDVIDDTEVSTFSFEEYPELPEIPEKSEVSVHEKIDIDETTDTKQQPTVRPIPEESVEIDSAEKSKLISSDDELKIGIDSKMKERETPEKTKLDTQILDSKIDKGAEVPDKEIQRVDLQIEPKEVPRTEVESTEIPIKPKEKDLDILGKTSGKTALEIQPKDLDNKQYQEKLEFEMIPKEEGIEIPEKMKEEFPGIPASTEEREIVSLHEKIDLDETPKSPTFSVTTREKETFDVIDDTEVSTFSFEEYPELPEIPEKSEVSVHEKIDIDETTDTKQQPTVKPIPEESVEIDSAEKSKLISSDDELKIDIDSKMKELETPEKTKLDTQILDSNIDKGAEVPDKEMQRVDLQIEPKEVPRTEVKSTEIQIKPQKKDLDILEKTSGKTALEIQPKDLDKKQYQEKMGFEIIPKEEGIEIPEKMKEEFPGIPASTEEREIVSLNEKIDLDETPKSPTFSVTTREKETFDVIDDTEVSTFSFEEYPELPEIPEKSEVSVHEKIDIDETTDTKQQPTVKPIPEESVEIDSAEKSKLISSDDDLNIDIDSKIKELETPEKTKLDTQILDSKIDKGAEVQDKEMQRVDLQIKPKEVPRTEVESTEIQIKPKEKDLDILEKTSGKTALEIQPKDLDNKQYQEKLEFEMIPKEEGIEIPEKMKEEFPGIPASTEEREIVSLNEKIDLDETPKSPTFSVTTREKETFDVIDDTEVSTFSFEEYPELPEIPEKSEVSVHEKIDIDETTDTKQQPTVKPIPEESVEIDSAEKSKLISSDDELNIDIDSKMMELETPEKTKLDTQILDSKIDKGAEVPDKEMQRVDLQIKPKEVPRTEVESTEIQIKPKEKDLDILEKTSGKTALEIQPKDLDNKQYQEKLEFEMIPKEEGIEIPEKMKEEFPGIPASTEEREIVSLNEKIDLDETPKSPTFSVTTREKESFDVIDDTEVSTFSFEEYPELPEIPEKSEVSVHEKIDIDETTDTKQQPTVKPIPEESVEIDSAEKSKLISSDDELKIDIDSKMKELETPEKTKLDTQILDSKIDKGAEVPDKEVQRVDLQIEPKEVPRTEVESTGIQIKPKEKDLDILEKTSGKTALEIQPKILDNKQYQEKLEFEIIPKEEGIEIPEKMKEEFPGIPASTEEREIVSLNEKIDLDETPKSPTFSVTTREKETFDVIDDTEVSTFSFEEYPELPEIPEKSEVSVHEKIDIDETTDTKQQPTVRPIPEESVEIDSAEKAKLISSDDELKIDIDSKIKERETPEKTKLDTLILDSKIDKGAEIPDKQMQRVDLQIEPKEVPRTEVERTEIQIEPKEKGLDILEKTSGKTALEIQLKDLDTKQYQEKLEFEIISKEEGIVIPEKMKDECPETHKDIYIPVMTEEKEEEDQHELIYTDESPESQGLSVTVLEKETYDVIHDHEESTVTVEEYPEIPETTDERVKVSLYEKIDLDETTKSPTFSVSVHEKDIFDIIDDKEVSTITFEEYPEFPDIPEKSEVSVYELIDIDGKVSEECDLAAPGTEEIVLYRDTIEVHQRKPQTEAKEAVHKEGVDLRNATEFVEYVQDGKAASEEQPSIKMPLQEQHEDLSESEEEPFVMIPGSAEDFFSSEAQIIETEIEKSDLISQEFDIPAPLPEVISLFRETIELKEKVPVLTPYALGATDTSYRESADEREASQMIQGVSSAHKMIQGKEITVTESQDKADEEDRSPQQVGKDTQEESPIDKAAPKQIILQAKELELLDELKEIPERPSKEADKFWIAEEMADLVTAETVLDEEAKDKPQQLTETVVEEEILIVPREDWTEVFVKKDEEVISVSEESDFSEESLEEEGYGIKYPDEDECEEEMIEVPKKRRGTITIITEDKEDAGVSYSEDIEIEETPDMTDEENKLDEKHIVPKNSVHVSLDLGDSPRRFESLHEDFELPESSNEIIEIDISDKSQKQPEVITAKEISQDEEKMIPILERVKSEDQEYVIEYPQEAEEVKSDLISQEFEVEAPLPEVISLFRETIEMKEKVPELIPYDKGVTETSYKESADERDAIQMIQEVSRDHRKLQEEEFTVNKAHKTQDHTFDFDVNSELDEGLYHIQTPADEAGRSPQEIEMDTQEAPIEKAAPEHIILQAKEMELLDELKEIPERPSKKADKLWVAEEMADLVTAETVIDEEIVSESLTEKLIEEEILIVPREDWTEVFVKKDEEVISESEESDFSEESLEEEGYGIKYPDEDESEEEMIEIPQRRRGTITIITEDKDDAGVLYTEEIEIEEKPDMIEEESKLDEKHIIPKDKVQVTSDLVGTPKFEPLQEDFELISSHEVIEIDISEKGQEQPNVVTAEEISQDKERIIPIMEKVKSEDQEYFIEYPQKAEEEANLESIELEEDSIYCQIKDETDENGPVKDISKVLGELNKEKGDKQISDLLENETDKPKEKYELSVSTETSEETVPKHNKELFDVLDSNIEVEEAENLRFMSSVEVGVSKQQLNELLDNEEIPYEVEFDVETHLSKEEIPSSVTSEVIGHLPKMETQSEISLDIETESPKSLTTVPTDVIVEDERGLPEEELHPNGTIKDTAPQKVTVEEETKSMPAELKIPAISEKDIMLQPHEVIFKSKTDLSVPHKKKTTLDIDIEMPTDDADLIIPEKEEYKEAVIIDQDLPKQKTELTILEKEDIWEKEASNVFVIDEDKVLTTEKDINLITEHKKSSMIPTDFLQINVELGMPKTDIPIKDSKEDSEFDIYHETVEESTVIEKYELEEKEIMSSELVIPSVEEITTEEIALELEEQHIKTASVEITEDSVKSISETPSQMKENLTDDELLTPEIIEAPLQVILEDVSLIKPQEVTSWAPENLEKPKKPGTW